MKRDRLVLFGLIAVAAALRVHWNDVPQYSRADEHVYAGYAQLLMDHSYRELVTAYLSETWHWIYPDPLRWAYLLLNAGACRVASHCDERTIAWVSTLAGIACVGLTWELARRLVSRAVALVSAALAVTSPLQLAMGRRALQDEVFCAAVLLALVAVAPLVTGDARRWQRVAAVGALTVAAATKETLYLLYPALVSMFAVAWRRRGFRPSDVTVLALPPLLHLVVFVLLTRSADDFLRVLSILGTASDDTYPLRYQAGPPHRILFDLFVLSPVVCALAAGAVTVVARRPDEAEPGTRLVALVTLLTALPFALVSSKNVRYAIPLDPLLRILAAWALVEILRERRLVLGLALLAMGAAELALFSRVFIAGSVYDPVTDSLLRAVRAIP